MTDAGVVLAAALAALGTWLTVAPVPRRLRHGWVGVHDRPDDDRSRSPGPGRGFTCAGRRLALALTVVALLGALLGGGVVGTRTVLLAVVLGGVVLAGVSLWRRRAAAERADRLAARVLEACEALAADLAAGQPPRSALERVGRDFTELEPLAGAARLGADVPHALRLLAHTPGAHALGLVAASWEVAERSGASLAPTLTRVADGLRDRRRTSRTVRAELASAWAATRLMVGLPVFFGLAGSSLGADPWGFLVGTTPGLVCLAVGLASMTLGVAWLQQIAGAVEAD